MSSGIARLRTKAWTRRRVLTLLFFALGFSLQFNMLPAGFGIPILRLSDGVTLVAVAVLLTFGYRIAERKAAVFFSLAVGLVALTLLLKFDVEDGDVYFVLIFLAALVAGFYFVAFARADPALVDAHCWGVVAGFAGAVAVQCAQAIGAPLAALGLAVDLNMASPETVVLSLVKPGGLWTHGNEAGHVYALAGAAALYLSLRRRSPAVYLLYVVGLLITFIFTKNRGGAIAPAIGLLICLARAHKGDLLEKAGLFSALVVTGIALSAIVIPHTTLSDVVVDRLENDSNVAANISDRLTSSLAAIGVAISHPFGIGRQSAESTLTWLTNIASAHNGMISLAFQVGIGFFIAYVVAVWRLWTRNYSNASYYQWLAFFATASLLFEDLALNSSFVFSMALIISAGCSKLLYRTRAAAASAPVPRNASL